MDRHPYVTFLTVLRPRGTGAGSAFARVARLVVKVDAEDVRGLDVSFTSDFFVVRDVLRFFGTIRSQRTKNRVLAPI